MMWLVAIAAVVLFLFFVWMVMNPPHNDYWWQDERYFK